MTTIHPMRLFEELEVRLIYRLCHPTFPVRPLRWHEAHPTLVLQEAGEIAGYTSYSLVMQPQLCADGEVMIGYGIDIKPEHHGNGYGRLLCTERLAVARAVGAKIFVGHAAPDNRTMIRLFEQDGFQPFGRAAEYTDGTPMQMYMGPVK